MTSASEERSGEAPLHRIVLFVLLVAHMQAGPLFKQVLHRPSPPTTMSWRMYGSIGKDMCTVEWFAAGSGELVPIDRLRTLGYEPLAAPDNVRQLRGVEAVEAAARRLCRALGPSADVRARARCGTPSGLWREAIVPERRLCGGAGRGEDR